MKKMSWDCNFNANEHYDNGHLFISNDFFTICEWKLKISDKIEHLVHWEGV